MLEQLLGCKAAPLVSAANKEQLLNRGRRHRRARATSNEYKLSHCWRDPRVVANFDVEIIGKLDIGTASGGLQRLVRPSWLAKHLQQTVIVLSPHFVKCSRRAYNFCVLVVLAQHRYHLLLSRRP